MSRRAPLAGEDVFKRLKWRVRRGLLKPLRASSRAGLVWAVSTM